MHQSRENDDVQAEWHRGDEQRDEHRAKKCVRKFKHQENLDEMLDLPAARVECIEIGRKLATGNFGDVHEGVASSLPVIGDRETKITVKV